MTVRGTIDVSVLAKALGHTPKKMHKLLRHRKIRTDGPTNKPYVWLSELQKGLPEAIESLRVLRSITRGPVSES